MMSSKQVVFGERWEAFVCILALKIFPGTSVHPKHFIYGFNAWVVYSPVNIHSNEKQKSIFSIGNTSSVGPFCIATLYNIIHRSIISFTYHPELIINAFMPRWTGLGASSDLSTWMGVCVGPWMVLPMKSKLRVVPNLFCPAGVIHKVLIGTLCIYSHCFLRTCKNHAPETHSPFHPWTTSLFKDVFLNKNWIVCLFQRGEGFVLNFLRRWDQPSGLVFRPGHFICWQMAIKK